MMSDLAYRTATEQAALIRGRAIGCLELLDHLISRIEQLDGRTNAVVVRDFDRARDHARKLDTMKGPLGPLHGVPMTVKESFDIAGLPTTWGVPEKRHDIAATDALAVERLKSAGAVVFGKTNVPRMLGDWQSFNEIYGTTNNPWDLKRTPGGSSGGGAAALAAGFSALECGSDIGGSIRQPAHACGLFGHKPTWGLLPMRGHAPVPGMAAATDISVIGPLARSAVDLATALDILAGPDPRETALTLTLPPERATSPRGLRVAVWPEDPATHTDAETTSLLRDLATHLEREGATVSLTARPHFDARAGFDVYLTLLSAALAGRAPPEERERLAAEAAALADTDHSAHAVLTRGALVSHGGWLVANERRYRIRQAWSAFFHDWDVMLCPVIAVPAQPHMQDQPTDSLHATINGTSVHWNELLFWPGISGGFLLPGSAAPLGLTRAGLPVGVQIVGAPYADRTTIAVARMLETNWRAFTAPPGWA